MTVCLPALRAVLVAGAALCAVAASQAQTDATNGDWTASFSDAEGRPRQATLKLDGATGTWRLYAFAARGGSKTNPCVAIDMPVAVRAGADDEVLVDIDGNKPVAGCPVFTLKLKRVDANTYDGSFPDSRAIHLVRQ